MQRQPRRLGAARAARLQHFGRKVQTRRGCGHGPTRRARIHGLVTLAILGAVLAPHVGRQRNVAHCVNLRGQFSRLAGKPERTLAKIVAPQHDGFERAVAEHQPVPRTDLAARTHQAQPVQPVAPRQRAHHQRFHFAGKARAVAEEPRRKHARLVQHQAIARRQIRGQIAEHPILPYPARTVHHQHARGRAIVERSLRDQVFGQREIEVGNVQYDLVSRILGLESSCDETAAAVVEDARVIRSSVVASQLDVHARYGGVVPELASREHLRAIVPVVREAMLRADIVWRDLDAVAVTQGPGLVGSLLVGITYAKAISLAHGLPLIAVNHIEGHIHAVLMEARGEGGEVPLPALALVASGGHTHLFHVNETMRYRLLGRTRDDAAGEAFDKVAKLLGFGYPGGPVIDLLAPHGDPRAIRFTAAKMKGNRLDFSFSGLKTAVLRWSQERDLSGEIAARRELLTRTAHPSAGEWLTVTPPETLNLLASFQHTVIAELLRRIESAAEQHPDVRAVVVSGGVACNAGLRTAAAALRMGIPVHFPRPALSTDNAAMIAAAAFPKLARAEFAGFELHPQANLVLAS
ncbi:MAG: tRNA (adenosine(37)-N6)-threonylcarbamoyltransferase complex transferase subunit TsaD [Bryobacterales bacterium]|nr:tRNA (adenosine(37)-N6)-threonylcarbamoyltransferase complex transferase subunit TsaD [Bryobacterales bacterium]